MSELRVTTYTMPSATLGPENPLPPLSLARDLHAGIPVDPSIPEEDQRYVGFGRVRGILPYRLQDTYDHGRARRDFLAVVLENDVLRATFLPELGGRLWSLLHKPAGRELLYVNPVFQPRNLALRNAWFSGGVEWNMGLVGHSPFTCSPLFTARLRADDGTPVLRLWEWERIRQCPFQIDAYLPDGSPVLFVRVTLTNPHDSETPAYWWSNIAVPEVEGGRVVAPADVAYRFGYAGGIVKAQIPRHEGLDVTYPLNLPGARDFFYRIPDGTRPWIAAADARGEGLFQTSTARLAGRKLFVWGTNPGGRHWQEFLSEPGHPYIEIQAGLARTQMEHLPMPPRAEWSWLEAYGMLAADPARVHGADWEAARRCAEACVDAVVPPHVLEDEYTRGHALARRPPEEIILRGSGWGALERMRREHAGEAPFRTEALRFDADSLTGEQAPWVELLRRGALPPRDPEDAPAAYLVQAEWRARLEEAARAGKADWHGWLQLGVMRAHAGELEGAEKAWRRSLAAAPSAWAERNLAVLAKHAGRLDEAGALWLAACRRQPSLLPLVVECGRMLIETGRATEWLSLLPELPAPVRGAGRMRALEAAATLATGDLDTAEDLLMNALIVDDIREGEITLSDLWFRLHAQRVSAAEGIPENDALHARVRREFPPPAHVDFRMSVLPGTDAT